MTFDETCVVTINLKRGEHVMLQSHISCQSMCSFHEAKLAHFNLTNNDASHPYLINDAGSTQTQDFIHAIKSTNQLLNISTLKSSI